MRTYTKFSIIAAALLVGLMPLNSQELPNTEDAGIAETLDGLYGIQLPDNGIIYISEDAVIGNTVLNISSLPYTGFADGSISPVKFYIKSNYASFISKAEIMIFKVSDEDLIDPLAVVSVPVKYFSEITWDGKIDKYVNFKAGDELIYILRVYDEEGRFDETSPNRIQLLKEEDVRHSKEELADSLSKQAGIQLSGESASEQYLLDKAFSQNMLSQQNILIHGSKVIIRGVSLPDNTKLLINNEEYPVDIERKFTAEYIVPAGIHYYDISLLGRENLNKRLKVDVSQHHFFGIGIADFTLRRKYTNSDAPSDVKDDDLFSDGRLAFYIKGKAYSKYQITAQADTTQREIKDLFKGFTQADATDIFQSLDPDMYYPTYGDDSTSFRDVNTQGKFYLKVDWDKSQALWGNYNTEFDGTQYGGYSRSLYGAKLDYRSTNINKWGDAKTTLKTFGSEAQSAPGHNEFLGTGGSLYYLRHTNIVPGSDKILLQVTDTSNGNTIAKIDLNRDSDYEIDNIQGRVILSRPLSQIIYQNVISITSTTPASGYEQRLIVDYEYVPNGFGGDAVSAGVRAKQWFGDYIALGGTYVNEERSGDNYEIMGGDLTLQAGKGTYIKTEFTQTKSSSSAIFYSNNGGLSFVSLGSLSNDIKGDAVAVHARVNFKELEMTNNELTVGAWWRNVEKGYSNSHALLYGQSDITEYGAEVSSEFSQNIKLYTKANKAERDDNSYAEAQITGEYRIADVFALSAEVKGLEEKNNATVKGILGALRVDYDITPTIETYLTGQFTIDNDNGAYENNDALIAGGRYLFLDSSVGGRYLTGHRGESAQVDVSHELNKDHTIYGGYTWSKDYVSDYDSVFGSALNTGYTIGQRWNITNSIKLYNESQIVKNRKDKGATNSLGMDFFMGEGWKLGFLYERGEFDSGSGDVDRDAFSVSLGRTSSTANWESRLEYRQDRGAEDREQWVTTNRLSYKVNDSLRLAGRFNYSQTDDNLNSQNGAEFTETNIGFSYRPFDSTKFAIFGKYTYLYDLASLGQVIVNGSEYDQKSQILSFEGIYKLDEKWEFALKYATRIGEARYGRGEGEWFDSKTSFYAGQIRYDILYKWHGLLEYRVLDVKDGGMKQGYMIGIDRDIMKNLRIGVGYNFTDFSDDLTKLDYKYRGWFINVVGTY